MWYGPGEEAFFISHQILYSPVVKSGEECVVGRDTWVGDILHYERAIFVPLPLPGKNRIGRSNKGSFIFPLGAL